MVRDTTFNTLVEVVRSLVDQVGDLRRAVELVVGNTANGNVMNLLAATEMELKNLNEDLDALYLP